VAACGLIPTLYPQQHSWRHPGRLNTGAGFDVIRIGIHGNGEIYKQPQIFTTTLSKGTERQKKIERQRDRIDNRETCRSRDRDIKRQRALEKEIER
jgi:hypothetical protein